MKTKKRFILFVVVFVLAVGLLVQANSKGVSPNADEIQSLETELIQIMRKEISPTSKITDRDAFLEGVLFAQRVVERIRIEGLLLSLRGLRDRKEFLAGLEDMCVLVESMNPEAEKFGLTQRLLQTDTELCLRSHGIKVSTAVQTQNMKFNEQVVYNSFLKLWECGSNANSDKDFLNSTKKWIRHNFFESYRLYGQQPTLYVNIHTISKEESLLAAFSIEVELQEMSYSCRNSVPVANTPVWKEGGIGTCPISNLKECVRECLRDKVNEFINDYLAANPKDCSSQNEQ